MQVCILTHKTIKYHKWIQKIKYLWLWIGSWILQKFILYKIFLYFQQIRTLKYISIHTHNKSRHLEIHLCTWNARNLCAPSRNYYFYRLKNFSQFKTEHGTIFKNYWTIFDCHNRSIIFNLNVSMYKLANPTFQSRDILKQWSAESIIQNLRSRRRENEKALYLLTIP